MPTKTRTKNGTPAPVDEAQTKQELDAQTVIWATPGTTGPNGYVPAPRQVIEWVDIPEVYPGMLPMRVGINVAVAMRVFDGVNAPGSTPRERATRRLSMIAPAFEGWNFADPITGQAIPCPDPLDYKTYDPLVWRYGALIELGEWVNVYGVTEALKQNLGNLKRASPTPANETKSEQSESAPTS